MANLKQKITANHSKTNDSLRPLPLDLTSIIPEQPLAWLKKYGLTTEEIVRHRFGWSPTYERLIYPVFDRTGNLVLWQGRFFNLPLGSDKKSKYFTCGNLDSVLAIFGDKHSPGLKVVVVEDVVSAIKVSRLCHSICLFGTSLSTEKMRQIAERYKELVIWLDPDKTKHAAKCTMKARPYFNHVRAIHTNKDPKDFSTKEMEPWLSPS